MCFFDQILCILSNNSCVLQLWFTSILQQLQFWVYTASFAVQAVSHCWSANMPVFIYENRFDHPGFLSLLNILNPRAQVSMKSVGSILPAVEAEDATSDQVFPSIILGAKKAVRATSSLYSPHRTRAEVGWVLLQSLILGIETAWNAV